MPRLLKAIGALCLFHSAISQDARVATLADACGDGEACGAESALALLQRGVAARQAAVAPEAAQLPAAVAPDETEQWGPVVQRLINIQALAKLTEEAKSNKSEGILDFLDPFAINCKANPSLCSDLLQCDKKKVGLFDLLQWQLRLTNNGKPNLRSWCLPFVRNFANTMVQECLVNKDLMESGRVTTAAQMKAGVGALEASYCFWEDLCSNDSITPTTTPEEAQAECDLKYPSWRKVGFKDLLTTFNVLESNIEMVFSSGGLGKSLSRAAVVNACAMGVYHCDVVICRDYYCKNPDYIKKFGSLSTKSTKQPR